jgi:hypothetical protein
MSLFKSRSKKSEPPRPLRSNAPYTSKFIELNRKSVVCYGKELVNQF